MVAQNHTKAQSHVYVDRSICLPDEAGLPLTDFVPLQLLFYTSDATSYTHVREFVFTTLEQGLLEPKQNLFQQLLKTL